MARRLTDSQQAKARAAAQRAAAIFGDAPIFDAPRVMPEALRRAVAGMISRTWNMLPHVAPMSSTSLTIQYVGTGAFTTHAWHYTAKRKLAPSGVVNLPALPAGRSMSRARATTYLGYCLHEVGGHWGFTHPGDWRAAVDYFSGSEFRGRFPRIGAQYAKHLLNALEDVRIERELIAAGTVRGAAVCLRATLAGIIEEARPEIDARNVRDFPFILAYCLREHAGCDDIADELPLALRAVYEIALAGLNDIRGCAVALGTANCFQLVLKVCTALHPLLKDAAPSPSPNTPQPAASDDDYSTAAGDDDDDDDDDDSTSTDDARDDDSTAAGDDDSTAAGDDDSTAAGDTPAPAPADATAAGDDDGAVMQKSENEDITGSAATGADVRNPNITIDGDVADYSGAVCEPQIVTLGESEDYAADVRARVQALGQFPVVRNALRRILERTDVDSNEPGKRAGRINAGALWRVASGADNVFKRRTANDGVRAAVAICIDCSGSMGYCLRPAVDAAIVLADVATSAGAAVDITGFGNATTYGAQVDVPQDIDDDATAAGVCTVHAFRTRQCALHVVKGFSEPLGVAYRRAPYLHAYGGTPDGAALHSVCERILKVDAARRIVIFVTDGEGDGELILGQTANRYAAQGITVIAVGIGALPACKAYPFRVEISNAADLGNAGMRATLAAVLKQQGGE